MNKEAKVDPVEQRLSTDWERMCALRDGNPFVDFTTEEVRPRTAFGPWPRKYHVTFTCRSIVGIDARRHPLFGDKHHVAIFLQSGYPKLEPAIKWVTEIYHPNVYPNKTPCTNMAGGLWDPTVFLDDVVQMLLHMAMWRNITDEDRKPFPAHPEVAKWSRWAKEQGILNKQPWLTVDPRDPHTGKGTLPGVPLPTPPIEERRSVIILPKSPVSGATGDAVVPPRGTNVQVKISPNVIPAEPIRIPPRKRL